VYPDRALITREATVPVKRGENLIQVPGLSRYLTDRSVQAGFAGRSDLVITEVKVDTTHLNTSEPAEVKALRDRLEVVENQIRNESDKVESIRSANEYLKKTVPFAQGQKVSTLEMESFLSFLEKTLNQNFTRLGSVQSRLAELNKERAALNAELGTLRRKLSVTKVITLRVLAPADVPSASLTVSYIASQVGWAPQYDARADEARSGIDLTYYASVWQNTGEDWDKTDVTISTSRPYVMETIPELSGWYLDVYTPRPVSRAKSAYESMDEVRMNVAFAEIPSPVDEFFANTPSVVEETTSFSFVLPGKTSIPADGEPHKVVLASASGRAEFSFFAIPRKAQNVFMKAKMANPFAFPLLPGTMNYFVQQKLLGSATLDETIVAAGGLEIPFGVDESVKIERKLKKKDTQYTGVLSRDITVSYEYTIDLTNAKSRPLLLRVQDQFPVSRNEKIKVTTEAPAGKDAQVAEDGIITWEVSLAPGAKQTLPLRFVISYPRDLIVDGLE
jgi:uncharacterized protein (TIGR02231 family)